jgi:hypothetical protein
VRWMDTMLSHPHATDKNNRGGGPRNLEPLSGVGLPFWSPSESSINLPQAKKVWGALSGTQRVNNENIHYSHAAKIA